MTVAVDKTDARVRGMFAAIARRYDLLNHLLSLNVDRYWRWRTVRHVPPSRPGTILDLCTGTGDLALAYDRAACRKGLPCRIVGADFCREMLLEGRSKVRRAEADDRICLLEADAQSLPLPDDSCQIVAVAFGLRNVHDTDRGLAEMVRVCAPGGRVAVLEFTMPERQPFRALYGWYFRRVLPRVGQLLARNRFAAYEYLPQSVGEFPQGEALTRRMREAGLQDVSHRALTCGIASLYVGRKADGGRETGDRRQETGDRRLETGDRRLETGDWG